MALSYTGVAAAKAVGRPRGVGSVDLYVATDAGIPEAELLTAIESYLEEKREISVDLRVLAPTPAAVDISVPCSPPPVRTSPRPRPTRTPPCGPPSPGRCWGKG